jgi:hypothetical protein
MASALVSYFRPKQAGRKWARVASLLINHWLVTVSLSATEKIQALHRKVKIPGRQ